MNPGIRYAVSVIVAVVVTLVTFWIMDYLISGSREQPENLEPPPGIRFGSVEIDETIDRRDRRRPPPPPPPDRLPPPPDMEIARVEQQVREAPRMEMPDLDFSMHSTGPFLGALGQAEQRSEGDVVPLVRIQPQYPREAAMNRTEGYVTVEFTIDETGAVRDPTVVESEPPRVFDREAVRAILRWRFKPRVVNGQPVSRRANQTIEFTMDDIR